MTNPTFAYGDVVYLKESAAIGYLEAVKIAGLHYGQNGWLYSIAASFNPSSPGVVQERRSLIGTQTLYYSEDELVVHRDALVLAEANAKTQFERLRAQRQELYPEIGTDS